VRKITFKGKRARVGILISSALLAGGSVAGLAVTSAPANAITATVDNNMLCNPGTGWCYQTNPPYNPSVPHYCQWDYKLGSLHSGMWYTGCQIWGPAIYPTS
jgi:hypothetical protein